MIYVYADEKLIYHPLDESLVITAPRLTLERGKAGSFQFGLPPNNKFYDALQKLKTQITVEIDDTEVFRGRILSETKDSYNVRTIYCEGDLAYLVDSVQKGEKYTGTTHALFRRIIEAHNARVDSVKRFEVGTIGIEDRDVILTGQSTEITDADSTKFDYRQIAVNSITRDWKTTYDYIDTCIIEYCGGYLRTRRENGKTYLDLMGEYESVADQQIEFGVNMFDLTEETTAEELFTVLIPLGDDNLTIESVNNGSDELVDNDLEAVYGRIVKTHVFENVTNPSTLIENGQRFLANHANAPATITIRAIDMHLQDSEVPLIKIGDFVPVKSKPHNIVRNLSCTRIEYDFSNLQNTTFTFGTTPESLTERYRKDKTKSADRAASSSGSSGGAAAEAAEEAAKEIGDKIYNAWINVDPETGHIDLGTLYAELKNTKEVLRNSCGINIDAPAGTINIYDLKEKYDEQQNEILNQGARIDLINDDTHAAIDLTVSRVTTLEGLVSGHYAEIKLYVDDLESAIDLKADKVTVDAINVNLNAYSQQLKDVEASGKEARVEISAINETVDTLGESVSKNEAKITTLSNETEASISSLVSRTAANETKTASITIKIDDMQSSINAKADKVTVDAMSITLNAQTTKVADLEKAGETAKVELSALSTTTDSLKKTLSQNEAKITALSSDTESKISALTTRVSNGETKEAGLEVRMNNVESEVELKADKTTINSKITTINSNIVEINGKIKSLQASVAEIDELVSKKISAAIENVTVLKASQATIKQLNVTDTITYSGTRLYTTKEIQNYVTKALEGYAASDHTHAWADITGKPTSFKPTKHRHTFSAEQSIANGHTHKVNIDGTTYTSQGASTNINHKVSISGNTGYYPT